MRISRRVQRIRMREREGSLKEIRDRVLRESVLPTRILDGLKERLYAPWRLNIYMYVEKERERERY